MIYLEEKKMKIIYLNNNKKKNGLQMGLQMVAIPNYCLVKLKTSYLILKTKN